MQLSAVRAGAMIRLYQAARPLPQTYKKMQRERCAAGHNTKAARRNTKRHMENTLPQVDLPGVRCKKRKLRCGCRKAAPRKTGGKQRGNADRAEKIQNRTVITQSAATAQNAGGRQGEKRRRCEWNRQDKSAVCGKSCCLPWGRCFLRRWAAFWSGPRFITLPKTPLWQ